LGELRAVLVAISTVAFFFLQGCQTLKEGAEISYAVRENGLQQERVTDAVRRRITSVAVAKNGLTVGAAELEYSTNWSYPKIEKIQISDRTLSRFIAAGGVFFTAGLAYFDKDFDRMWGDERLNVRVVDSWLDRTRGQRVSSSTTVQQKALEGHFTLTVSKLRAERAEEVFSRSVNFRAGTASIVLDRAGLKLARGEEAKFLITIDQPSDLRPVPHPFRFDVSLGSQVFFISGMQEREVAPAQNADPRVSSEATRRKRCMRIGLKEGSNDFDLCMRSLK